MNGYWKGYDFHFQTTHLTYTQCINEDWVTVTLFSNYAFDVHTVYQWGLSDRYHYFQTTHLTYTQLVYLSMRTEWLLLLFSNYAFDVHTVSVSMRTEWPLSLFSNYTFDVHTVSVSMRTDIIILKLRIWRTHSVSMRTE